MYLMWIDIRVLQGRVRVLTNRSMAGMLGMHGDEILARFANHEVGLPFSETDGLRLFIYDLGALRAP